MTRKELALIVAAVVAAQAGVARAQAPPRVTVCAASCVYTNDRLQAALDAVPAGGEVLLQSGFTYVGTFLLRQKTCAANDATCFTTIRTGVAGSGALLPDAVLTPTHVRMTPQAAAPLAKLRPSSPNSPAVRTVKPSEFGAGCSAAPCRANWWRLSLLDVGANTWAGGELLRIGSYDLASASPSGDAQDRRAEIPAHFLLDRLYVHGDPLLGQKRGIGVYANDVTIRDSYISDVKNVVGDGQCIGLNNAEGPFTITNNYLSCDTENFLAGGDTPRIQQSPTVRETPAPTATVFALTTVQDLQVGQGLSCKVNGGTIDNVATVTAIDGYQVTVSPAMITPPDVPGQCNYGVVMKGLTFTKNYVTKPLEWKDPIVPTPTGVSAAPSEIGGTLPEGTYAYRVVARQPVGQSNLVRSTASAEAKAVVPAGGTGSVAVMWAPVANATSYDIYGRTPGFEAVRFSVNAPATSFTDTGGAGVSASVPTTPGNRWIVKNDFELKHMQGALAEGNVFEHSWLGGQVGCSVLFTVANSSGGNSSTVISDVTFRNNIVRGAACFTQVTGHDASSAIQTSQRTQRIAISNNLIYDIGAPAWTTSTSTPSISIASAGNAQTAPREGPKDVSIVHNTLLASGENSFVIIGLGASGVDYKAENFVVRDNIFRRGSYGLRYVKSPGGTQAEGAPSWTIGTAGASTFAKNVIQGAACSVYPVGQFCPAEFDLEAGFQDYARGDYRLKPTAQWAGKATDGTDIGADVAAVVAATQVAVSGDDRGAPPPPPSITTAALPDAATGVPYTAALDATGCGAGCAWDTASGQMPPGLSLAPQGAIKGTPSAPGPFAFTARATADTGQVATKDLALEVQPRQEGALYVRPESPTEADGLHVGDVWVDTTNMVVKYLVSIDPVQWRELFAGTDGSKLQNLDASSLAAGTVPAARLGDGEPAPNAYLRGDNRWVVPRPPTVNLPFSTAASSYVNWSMAQAPTEIFGALRNRIAFDLTGFTECRMYARVKATADARAWAQYSVDGGTTWADLGAEARAPGVALSEGSDTMTVSAWAPLAPGASADVLLRVVGAATAPASPTIGNIGLNCR